MKLTKEKQERRDTIGTIAQKLLHTVARLAVRLKLTLRTINNFKEPVPMRATAVHLP